MLLGLDLGTTNIKALVVDDDGAIRAEGAAPVPLHHVADGGVEQDIEEIWHATLDAIRAAGRHADLSAVRAVGISSQGAATQVRTRDGQCRGPVISWMDARGAALGQEVERQHDTDWFAERVGHGGAGIGVSHVLRLRELSPGRLAEPSTLGFVGDTIVQRLTGRAAHDHSSLSITGLYNPSRHDADPDVLGLLGLQADQLPDLLPPREPAGPLKATVAEQTGLPAGIPVSPALHDQYAAALGCGAINPGDVMFGAGTAWVLLAIADHLMRPIVPSAYVCDHLVPGRWGQMFSLVVGGSAFRWALSLSNLTEASSDSIDDLLDSVPPGSDGLRVLPFLDGNAGYRRPAAGAVEGARFGHGPAHLLRATVEGLCCELARQLRWLTDAGCPVGRLVMCGGVTRTRATPQMVADVTGCPIVCPDQAEISAFGAAIIARAMVEPQRPLEALHVSMAGAAREIRPGPAAPTYAAITGEYVRLTTERAHDGR